MINLNLKRELKAQRLFNETCCYWWRTKRCYLCFKSEKDYPNDKVVIIESSDKLLKRVLVSGNGRANFFNQELLDNSIDKAYDNKDAALKIIEKDYASKTLSLLRELGLIYIIVNAEDFILIQIHH